MVALSELCQEILTCQRCQVLAENRTRVVPGEGAEDADIVFIGEAPGWHEDQQGRPFVGPAGMFLNQLINSIELISPKMVVTLGRYSMAMFFPGKSISKIHGTAQRQDNIIYYAMYHPAAALHQQSLRQVVEADMLKIPQILAGAEMATEARPEPKQLNMFEG
jgi:uracil-DNA glycosylase